MKQVTYKTSGVDIDQANIFVDQIKGLMTKTMSRNVLKRKGAFGALYDLYGNGGKDGSVLVSSTDGVGTKLLIAQAAGKHDTVGVDLVAMNVNDILCVGAKPLFFLDYIACGKLQPKVLSQVVKGIAAGCCQSGCALIGGETAEMPGMYKADEYDLAGFAVGLVEKDKIIDGQAIREGDVLVGLASSGLHSNGFSLARKALGTSGQRKYSTPLLEPTRIYVKVVLDLLGRYDIRGMAHITGGAFYEKLTKILPSGKAAAVRKGSWPVPEIFEVIQRKGHVSDPEMYRTFNMGIGFVCVVAPEDVKGVCAALKRKKTNAYIIGEVVRQTKGKLIL